MLLNYLKKVSEVDLLQVIVHDLIVCVCTEGCSFEVMQGRFLVMRDWDDRSLS